MTGSVIWITGLSGAGKSTLAKEVVLRLKKLEFAPILLDGDSLRGVSGATDKNSQDFSRSSRLALSMTYCKLCKLLSDQGFIVVIATISMYEEIYAWNRKHLPHYFEVYMKASFDALRKRDPKGIYRDFDSQLIKNVAGLDLQVDEPETPDFVGSIEDGMSSHIAKNLIDDILKRVRFEN